MLWLIQDPLAKPYAASLLDGVDAKKYVETLVSALERVLQQDKVDFSHLKLLICILESAVKIEYPNSLFDGSNLIYLTHSTHLREALLFKGCTRIKMFNKGDGMSWHLVSFSAAEEKFFTEVKAVIPSMQNVWVTDDSPQGLKDCILYRLNMCVSESLLIARIENGNLATHANTLKALVMDRASDFLAHDYDINLEAVCALRRIVESIKYMYGLIDLAYKEQCVKIRELQSWLSSEDCTPESLCEELNEFNSSIESINYKITEAILNADSIFNSVVQPIVDGVYTKLLDAFKSEAKDMQSSAESRAEAVNAQHFMQLSLSSHLSYVNSTEFLFSDIRESRGFE